MDIDSLQQSLKQTEVRSKAIARHIAVHLRVLMLLTLRFASSQKIDKALADDDLKSDCTDIDDEESSPKCSIPDDLSDIDSRRDGAMEGLDDENDSGVAKDLNDDLVEDRIAVPDTDFGLGDIPRQYDGLIIENDAPSNGCVLPS